MNRRAKGLRIIGGIVILFNIVFLFLPMSKYVPANYPAEHYSQWDYMVNMFKDEAPYNEAYTTGRIAWVLLLIVVPLIISLVAGIWGIVGNDRQIVSSILILVTYVLYIALYTSISAFFPQSEYTRDIAGVCNLICGGVAGVLAIVALLYRGEEPEEPVFGVIPDVQEFKQEQIQAKYNIISESDSGQSGAAVSAPEKERSINPFADNADSFVAAEAHKAQSGNVQAGATSNPQAQNVQQPSPQQQNVQQPSPQQQNVQQPSPQQQNMQQPSPQQQNVQQPSPQQQNVQAPSNNQQSTPPYVPGPPRGVMVGLTGLYAGAEIPFKNGETIKLGRHPDNELIFDGQEKVSRNHCCIKWNGDEKKFYIKDVSSNGTFIQGLEDCLPQNIEIEVPLGSVIEIGDESNSFRLE